MVKSVKLLITIETIAREFDYKFVIARELAKHGYEVHLVACDYYKLVLYNKSKDYVLLDKVLLDYTTKTVREGILKRLNNNNVHLIYLNEESAVLKGHGDIKRLEFELNSMYDISVFNKMNIVISAGKFQHEYSLNKKPVCEVIPVGIPRFSLYSNNYKRIYKTLIENLHEVYGEFVLINTNYSLFNSATGIKDVFSLFNPENNLSFSDSTKEISLSYINEGRQVFAFIELILEVAQKYENLNFVIRPHPSEDPNFYYKFFIGRKNVFVNTTGSVNELLFASMCLIHNGCTTAIEGVLAGVPVFAFDLIRNSKYICSYPNEFGRISHSLDDFIYEFEKFITEKLLDDHKKDYLKMGSGDYLYNVEDNDIVLSKYLEVILGVLSKNNSTLNSRLRFSLLGLIKLYIIIPILEKYSQVVQKKGLLGKYFNAKRKFPGFKSTIFGRRHDSLSFDDESCVKVRVLNNFHMIVNSN